jgi:hypothetical protein
LATALLSTASSRCATSLKVCPLRLKLMLNSVSCQLYAFRIIILPFRHQSTRASRSDLLRLLKTTMSFRMAGRTYHEEEDTIGTCWALAKLGYRPTFGQLDRIQLRLGGTAAEARLHAAGNWTPRAAAFWAAALGDEADAAEPQRAGERGQNDTAPRWDASGVDSGGAGRCGGGGDAGVGPNGGGWEEPVSDASSAERRAPALDVASVQDVQRSSQAESDGRGRIDERGVEGGEVAREMGPSDAVGVDGG